ncbi:ABC transporter substrate-binding protein [Bosea sp. (in: a-proteobacteria)]|uniref:ABC transporter substrate-binding protein n=1 Tax=Bosea sp. (in: a-proteobacteria) TaxID=1871050 RepID=UPI002DDD1A97|nr:ABC transporter substrate-binding protein [Bosea sp. (in: a-proteobacteria)]HEV2508348.1 ABC transporter substrate-binding protein [Bosea sp. (in: a-proteobacteria)]
MLVGAALATTAASAQQPIKIGVPLPLTGALAGGGTQILWGIQYATDEINEGGGLFGRKIELVVEDTKGEANTSATVAAKLATQDKVDAFVGGFGSTSDFALLNALQRYEPIFVHPGSSSVRLEESFGKHDWYYHVYIWDYHRQKAAVNFFKSIPGVKTLAIAYEDKLYGTDGAKFTQQYAKEAGLDVVMNEPFRAGTPDFSPILNRAKGLNPDVLFLIGYSGDNIQIARQATQLGIKPKLLVTQGAGEKRSDFGPAGDNVVVIDLWSAKQTTPGLAEWVKKAEAKRGGEVVSSAVQGYVAMQTLRDAVKAAGSWDRAKILANLGSMTFDTPYGKVAYSASEMGGKHQLITDKSMIAVQYKPDGGQEVVWPAEKAAAKITYPAP